MAIPSNFILAIELSGTGIHPMAWRRPDSCAEHLFTAAYWVRLLRTAETIGFDVAFLPDAFVLQSGGEAVQRGRLDAVAIAAHAAPMTSAIGLIPTVGVTHTEPFHVSKAIATLDHISGGRAGWQPEAAREPDEYRLFGRKAPQENPTRWAEAAEFEELVVRLWDSWEDDAVIRDLPTGRYLDRTKVHAVDFAGEFFRVAGPSITPRPPQGHPVIAAYPLDESRPVTADLVRITALSIIEAASTAAKYRTPTNRVLLDLEVLLEDSAEAAHRESDRLMQWAGAPFPSNSLSYIGSAGGLTDLLEALAQSGSVDGVTLRPLALAPVLANVPSLHPIGRRTLRERLGLERPQNLHRAHTEPEAANA